MASESVYSPNDRTASSVCVDLIEDSKAAMMLPALTAVIVTGHRYHVPGRTEQSQYKCIVESSDPQSQIDRIKYLRSSIRAHIGDLSCF